MSRSMAALLITALCCSSGAAVAGNRAKGSTVTVQLDATPPPAPSLNGLVQVTRNARWR